MNIPSEASLLARELIGGVFDHDAVSRELISMAARGDSIDEIRDMAVAFRDAAIPVCTKHEAVADLCGTGGAPFRTFNCKYGRLIHCISYRCARCQTWEPF